jgi:hypothetical protein
MDQTGLDVELTLTSHADRSRGYHKGDGVKFLVDSFGLDLADGPVLVCGDTPSDLPMLESLVAMGVPTHAIFVAADAELEERVRRLTPHCAFCTGPDVLVTALGIAGQALAPERHVHRTPTAEDHDE